jgi:hypothetical protein
VDIIELISNIVTVISKGTAILDAVIKIINEGGNEVEKLWNSNKK